MAKDDYHVIVYQILAYLYQCLKEGKDIDARQISAESDFYKINRRYWSFIMVNLLNDEYISGVVLVDLDGIEPTVSGLERCMITPKGIEYLTENSTIAKAKEFFNSAKSILPFFVGV